MPLRRRWLSQSVRPPWPWAAWCQSPHPRRPWPASLLAPPDRASPRQLWRSRRPLRPRRPRRPSVRSRSTSSLASPLLSHWRLQGLCSWSRRSSYRRPPLGRCPHKPPRRSPSTRSTKRHARKERTREKRGSYFRLIHTLPRLADEHTRPQSAKARVRSTERQARQKPAANCSRIDPAGTRPKHGETGWSAEHSEIPHETEDFALCASAPEASVPGPADDRVGEYHGAVPS